MKVWADENLHIIVEDQVWALMWGVETEAREKKEGHTNIGIHNVEEMIRMEYWGKPWMWTRAVREPERK